MTTKKIIRSITYYNEEEALSRIPSTIETLGVSGEQVLKSSSLPANSYNTNRPKKYNKKNSDSPLTPEDFFRHNRNLLDSLKCNFKENDKHCWLITLTIKDKRIKTVEKARKLAIAYCKSFDSEAGKAVYSIVVELDWKHHPHVHLILQTSDYVSKQEVKNKWDQGYVCAEQAPDNWERITNYLIKPYPYNEKLIFDVELSKQLTKKLHMLKHLMKGIKAIHTPNYNEILSKAYKLRDKVKAKLKKENQKQLTKKDRFVYLSYRQKKVIADKNVDNKTAKKLMKEKANYIDTKKTVIQFVTLETGEIQNAITTYKDYYK